MQTHYVILRIAYCVECNFLTSKCSSRNGALAAAPLLRWMVEVLRVRALSALVRTVLNLLLTGANGRYRCNTYVHLLLRMHPRIYTRLRQAALDGRVLEVE